MMHSDVDDVRDAADSYQLNVDREKNFTDDGDMAEVRGIDDSGDPAATQSNDAASGCDLVSKPTAAPLSWRASAFSIAALMKDCDTDAPSAGSLSGRQHHLDTDARHTTGGSLYDIATDIAADQWQRQDRDYSRGANEINANTDADYWSTFSNTSQRRMYI